MADFVSSEIENLEPHPPIVSGGGKGLISIPFEYVTSDNPSSRKAILNFYLDLVFGSFSISWDI